MKRIVFPLWPTLRRHFAVAAIALLGATGATAQQQSIVNSPHNLSASGPGGIRAVGEQQVCIFCHTPHHASDVRPLWNRTMPTAAYTPYRSNSLQALPDQPTGTSKLCLSCHDGTIALGDVVSRRDRIPMSGGVTTMPPGRSNLSTDLSDDHPVSFAYDQALLQKNPKLRNPTALPERVKLDGNNEMQCVSCHDPHDNQFGKFLVMSNTGSQLCTSCHIQGTTTVASHVECASCHQPHSAPSGPYLLKQTTVTATCTQSLCHGTQANNPRLNIAGELAKFAKHDTNSAVNLADHVPNNAVCTDCHEGHTMGTADAPAAPAIQPRLGKIDGVNASGNKIAAAQYEFEVCFKCHADNAATNVTVISRVAVQTNKRLQTAPNAVSFHPVQVPRNVNSPSLRAPYTSSSVIYCTDCHASNSSRDAGAGAGPNGPHGSVHPGLLRATYTTADYTTESPQAYALCYTCHDRTSILNNDSFPLHRQHIVDLQAPCSACHDSHGIASGQGTATNNAHLINFDRSIVQPHPGRGGPTYISRGPRAGNCTLSCHGQPHNRRPY